ncbi:MAG: ribonuclease G [Pseudomonadota bacterium]
MSIEILMNVTPQETRVAMVENGVVQELHVERQNKRGIVGNVYKGKVSRVLPGMQAAFVDIGLDKAAFLHVSDLVPTHFSHEENEPPGDKNTNLLDISHFLTEGQELVVQIIKEPLGTKGARLTAQITIPSRYLVLMVNSQHIGVSQRIEDEDERERHRKILHEFNAKQLETERFGYIVRTAAEGASESELLADASFLSKIWRRVFDNCTLAKPGDAVYVESGLELRTLRDWVSAEVERIRLDSKEAHAKAINFCNDFIPDLELRIEYYSSERPLFDLYNIEDEILRALARKVPLKSGGYLIIDQTEAMTTIDVNTGAFVGHRNLEETIFKTNLEAAHALARQLRLRNLGGIIIIDFIDMIDENHKSLVLSTLEKALEKDHAKTQISQVSPLGLVEMTRKRTRESLGHVLCESCSECNGRGYVKTPETVCYEVFREIMRSARAFEANKYLVLAAQPVVDLLLDEESSSVADLEALIGKQIHFQVESLYTQEQFDVVLM